jgi:hypothetical protein
MTSKLESNQKCAGCNRIDDLVECDECHRLICDEDYDFEYQMCYDCSNKVNESLGYTRSLPTEQEIIQTLRGTE